MSLSIRPSIHEAAVGYAALAERAARQTWAHLDAEYTQDLDKVIDTLVASGPYSWTLPVVLDDGTMAYRCETTVPDIRRAYEDMRQEVLILRWRALAELRSPWYVLTQGVVDYEMVPDGSRAQREACTMFPVSDVEDGILGEVQFAREDDGRWPEVPAQPGDQPMPQSRLETLGQHVAWVEALAAQDLDALMAPCAPQGPTAIRDYRTDEHVMVNLPDATALRAYYGELFGRIKVRQVDIVHRLVENWYLFFELHWVVERRDRGGAVEEFCTADIWSLDREGRFWCRTGQGTDPVEVDR